MPATPAWLATVEVLLNRGLDASSPAQGLAMRLRNASLRVDIEGFAPIRVSIAGNRLIFLHSTEAADAELSGSPSVLWRLASGRQTVAESSVVSIRGDAEVADLYRRLFLMVRPDPEEELARVFGDLPARRLSRLAGQTLDWLRSSRRTAGLNVAEYLQEESRDLVNRPELEEFLLAVDTLRETADRIEARLTHLEQRVKGAGP